MTRIDLKNGMILTKEPNDMLKVWDADLMEAVYTSVSNLDKNSHQFLIPVVQETKDFIPKIHDIKSDTDWVGNKIKIDTSKIDWNDISEICGFMVGDGSYSKKRNSVRIYFGVKQLDNLVFVVKFFKNIGMNVNFGLHKVSSNCAMIETNAMDFLDIMDKIGFEREVEDKKSTPYFIFNGTKEMIARYMRGLFESDGSVVFHKHTGRVRFGNIAIGVVDDMQELLYKIGIHSKVRNYKDKRSTRKVSKYIEISSFHDIVEFRNVIGFRSKYNKDKLDRLINSRSGNIQMGDPIMIRPHHKKRLSKIIGGDKNSNFIGRQFVLDRIDSLTGEYKNLLESCLNYRFIKIDKINREY